MFELKKVALNSQTAAGKLGDHWMAFVRTIVERESRTPGSWKWSCCRSYSRLIRCVDIKHKSVFYSYDIRYVSNGIAYSYAHTNTADTMQINSVD